MNHALLASASGFFNSLLGIVLDRAAEIEFDERTSKLLKLVYYAEDLEHLKAYISQHGRAFLDVHDWSRCAAQYGFCFGTRLHGTIMALNSGTPALLMHHDGRTRELCDFSKFPSLDANEFYLSAATLQKAYETMDFDAYYKTREANKEIYRGFLAQNQLEASIF